jgi:hypothetical protein
VRKDTQTLSVVECADAQGLEQLRARHGKALKAAQAFPDFQAAGGDSCVAFDSEPLPEQERQELAALQRHARHLERCAAMRLAVSVACGVSLACGLHTLLPVDLAALHTLLHVPPRAVRCV